MNHFVGYVFKVIKTNGSIEYMARSLIPLRVIYNI